MTSLPIDLDLMKISLLIYRMNLKLIVVHHNSNQLNEPVKRITLKTVINLCEFFDLLNLKNTTKHRMKSNQTKRHSKQKLLFTFEVCAFCSLDLLWPLK